MTAKEHAGSYGSFEFDPRAVAADATKATVSMTLAYTEAERGYVRARFGHLCPETDEVVIEIQPGGNGRVVKNSFPTKDLLSSFSRAYLDSPGFFDYIDAYRQSPKQQLSTWDANVLNESQTKTTLNAAGPFKFQYTKQYLAAIKMRDLQIVQGAWRSGTLAEVEGLDSLQEIRQFFDSFFAPMRFLDVNLDKSPFEFIISTPRGVIDIDDLSAGEKEILTICCITLRFDGAGPWREQGGARRGTQSIVPLLDRLQHDRRRDGV